MSLSSGSTPVSSSDTPNAAVFSTSRQQHCTTLPFCSGLIGVEVAVLCESLMMKVLQLSRATHWSD